MRIFYAGLAMLLSLWLPLRLQAQTSFRAGYIITPQGDTLTGSLYDSGGTRGNSECRFKAAATDGATKYEPAQLRGYGFLRDRFYQSHQIPFISSYTADTTAQRVFLEVLVKGAATLFYFAGDNSVSSYFIRIDNGPVQPLVLQTSYMLANGTRIRQEKAVFRGTLATAFRPCPAVQATVGSVRFTSSDLVRITRQYNDCVGGAQVVSEVAAASRRSYFRLEGVAGVQTSTLKFAGDIDLRGIAIAGGLRPVVGIAVQQYIPVLANRLGLRAELLYQPQRYEAVVAGVFGVAAQDVRVRLDQLRLPVALRYKPLAGRLQPFVEVGGSLALALTNTNEYRYRTQNGSPSGSWNVILPSPRSVEQSLLLGAGAAWQLANQRRVTASVRAERTNGFSDAVGITTAINRFYFLLNYDLSKPR